MRLDCEKPSSCNTDVASIPMCNIWFRGIAASPPPPSQTRKFVFSPFVLKFHVKGLFSLYPLLWLVPFSFLPSTSIVPQNTPPKHNHCIHFRSTPILPASLEASNHLKLRDQLFRPICESANCLALTKSLQVASAVILSYSSEMTSRVSNIYHMPLYGGCPVKNQMLFLV